MASENYLRELANEMLGRYDYLCPLCSHNRFRVYANRCIADIYNGGQMRVYIDSDEPDYSIECTNCGHELTCGAAGG